MAGQGFHLGIGKTIADQLDEKLFYDKRFIAGVLTPDSLNMVTGSRRRSHFCGGAGSIYPIYPSKASIKEGIKSFDLETVKSYIVDPEINLDLFAALNKHISNDDPYKIGIFAHLLSDYYYDQYIQNQFDFSLQDKGIVIKDGQQLDDKQFRQKALYSAYPMIDQYCFNIGNINLEDVQKITKIITENFTEEQANFLIKYINYNANLAWQDTDVYTDTSVKKLVKTINSDFNNRYKKL